MASGTWGDPNVYTKAETDAAIQQSAAIEKFSVTFPSSITDLQVRGMNCWYEPDIGKVHISFAIMSPSKLIPSRATSGSFAYIPEKYRPKTDRTCSFVFFGKDGSNTSAGKVCPEMTNISTNGGIIANYWIYGEEYSYSAWVDFDYLID